MAETKLPLIEVGYQVFAKDGGEEFGAVRDVVPGGRPEIVVYVENSHEFTIPLSAVVAVHSEKVLVDLSQLPGDLQEAVRHAHEAEQF
jgi:ribosomal 30S subunit maturation factor RimM